MEKTKKVTIIGHRGAGEGKHPEGGLENTLESFGWAFKNGANEIETDLVISKDNVLFIFHDQFLKKTLVRDLNSKEIKKYAPFVPTFFEMVAKFPEKTFVLELKRSTDWQKIFDKVYKDYKKYISQFKFISFSLEALKYIKKIDKKVYCIYIATCKKGRFEPFVIRKHIDSCLENNFEEISGLWLAFRPRMIRMAQESGLEVGLGMINGKRALNYCLKNGVRRIYTDKVREISKNLE